MGNTIKNYERKKRREQKEAQKELRKVVHDTILKECGFTRTFKEKGNEIFNSLNKKTSLFLGGC